MPSQSAIVLVILSFLGRMLDMSGRIASILVLICTGRLLNILLSASKVLEGFFL
jgi:hypothetical protein